MAYSKALCYCILNHIWPHMPSSATQRESSNSLRESHWRCRGFLELPQRTDTKGTSWPVQSDEMPLRQHAGPELAQVTWMKAVDHAASVWATTSNFYQKYKYWYINWPWKVRSRDILWEVCQSQLILNGRFNVRFIWTGKGQSPKHLVLVNKRGSQCATKVN